MSTVIALEDWITSFRQEIGRLYQAVDDFAASEPDPVVVAEAVSALHAARADLTMVWESLVGLAVEVMGALPEVTLTDGTKIEKRNASDRKTWDHQSIARAVAERITDLSVNPMTGERTMTPDEMIVALLDYAAPSYWRVKALSGIGIDADRYCETTEGKPSIIVRKAKTL